MNESNQNAFIEFLFKCLDKHERKASVLFSNLDLENERVDVLNRLMNDYQDMFDFNMINPKQLVKSSSFLLNELNKLKIEYTNKISELKTENQKQQELFTSSQQLLNETKNQLIEKKKSTY